MRWCALLVGLWLALRGAMLMLGAELGEARTLSLHGHRVSVLYLHGQTPSDTLLVVTHGGLASKETVLPLCWEARHRGVDCVAVDALGHGESSAQPARDTIGASARALQVHTQLDAQYTKIRFIGHSMGAYLGRGHAYPCASSFALGQGTVCDDDRVVWGTLHRTLGLGDNAYLLAHVLESWTPWVVRRALDRTLGAAPTPSHLGALITLAWLSFAVAGALGVLLARMIRAPQARSWPPLLRGLLGASAVWCGLTVGGWRALWWLLPTQLSDLVVVAATLTMALALTWISVWLVPQARLGRALGVMSALGIAFYLYVLYSPREMGTLMLLLPTMSVPLVPWVWLWHGLSRIQQDEVESATFCALLLSLFVALLLPAF